MGEKKARHCEVAEPGVSQKIKFVWSAVEIPLPRIQNPTNMKLENLKKLIGLAAGIKVTSECRFSKLLELMDKATKEQSTVLTIVVKDGTLTSGEILMLAELGGEFIVWDMPDE